MKLSVTQVYEVPIEEIIDNMSNEDYAKVIKKIEEEGEIDSVNRLLTGLGLCTEKQVLGWFKCFVEKIKDEARDNTNPYFFEIGEYAESVLDDIVKNLKCYL